MSYGARCLYIILAGYVSNDGKNNGSVYRSHRDACSDLGTRSKNSIERWFGEIEHYGFAVKTYEGALGLDGWGEAPHWRLTEYPTLDNRGYHVQATRDFDRWDGVLFISRRKPPEKTESRPHDEGTLPPPQGQLPPWETPDCPHNGDICFEPEVPSQQGHILVTTPLSVPKPDLVGEVLAIVHAQLDDRDRRYGEAQEHSSKLPWSAPTLTELPFESLAPELRMLALGLPVSVVPNWVFGRKA